MAVTWTQGWPGRGGRPGKLLAGVLAALVTAGMVVALVRSGHLTNDGGSTKATATSSAQAGGAAPVESVARDSAAIGTKSLVAPDVAQGKPVSGGVIAEPVPPSVGTGDGSAIVRSAEMAVRLKGVSAAAAVARLGSAVEGMGGYVASTTSSDEAHGRGSADLVLRVPSERFDAARKAVAGLGKVTSVSLSGDDVSGQLVDLDARLRTVRAEELALTELLGTSRDIAAILQVRDRLTATRSEIEQLAGQQARVRDQVRLASISVSLREAAAPTTSPGSHHKGFGNDLRTAGNALVAVVGGTLIVAAALAPIALLALLALLAARRYGRRHAAAG